MIRRAKISEIANILEITKACALFMESKGIYQWNEAYPTKEAFTKDIERNELFVLEKENVVIGTIVISTMMDEHYKAIKWLSPNLNNIYIHRLSVHPERQRKGHARHLMDFAENRAKKNGYISVRLDTFSQNKSNQRFYEARGYKRLGDVYFPQQSEHPFHCYELLL